MYIPNENSRFFVHARKKSIHFSLHKIKNILFGQKVADYQAIMGIND